MAREVAIRYCFGWNGRSIRSCLGSKFETGFGDFQMMPCLRADGVLLWRHSKWRQEDLGLGGGAFYVV